MSAAKPNDNPRTRSSDPWSRLFLPGCLLVYLALAVTYSFVFPLGQAPDEPAHFQYVLFLAQRARLPDFYRDPQAGYESYQAPLYYTLSAAIGKLPLSLAGGAESASSPPAASGVRSDAPPSQGVPAVGGAAAKLVAEETHEAAREALRSTAGLPPAQRTAWHTARLVSVLFGALGIWLAYAIVHVVFPGRPHLAALVAAGIAAQPMYVHITSSVGNDAATVAVVGAALLLVLLILREGPAPHRVALLGLVLGLGMLTKDSALITLPVALLALVWAVGKRYKPEPSPSFIVNLGRWLVALRWARLLRSAGLMLGVALVVGGWWYVRNTVLYGKPVHYPVNVDKRLPWDIYLLYPQFLWPTLRAAARMTFRNFWATFGWTNVAIWPPAYDILLALSLVPALGWIGLIVDSARGRLGWTVFQRRAFWLLVSALALMMIGVLRYVLFIHFGGGSQGRYYFPVLPSLGMLAALGIDRLLPGAAKKAAPFLVGGLMLLFNLYCLFGYIVPYYSALTDAP